MKKRGYSEHHLIPKSQGGTNHKDNKVLLSQKEHNKLHNYYGNKKPVDQLLKTLETNYGCFKAKFLQDIFEVINLYGDFAYKEHCKKNNFIS